MVQKELQEVQDSMDVKGEIYDQLCERIEGEQDYGAMKSQEDRDMVLDVLSQFTHLFDNRKVGEARQSGTMVTHQIHTGSAALDVHIHIVNLLL